MTRYRSSRFHDHISYGKQIIWRLFVFIVVSTHAVNVAFRTVFVYFSKIYFFTLRKAKLVDLALFILGHHLAEAVNRLPTGSAAHQLEVTLFFCFASDRVTSGLIQYTAYCWQTSATPPPAARIDFSSSIYWWWSCLWSIIIIILTVCKSFSRCIWSFLPSFPLVMLTVVALVSLASTS